MTNAADLATRTERVRGLMLGLALGDALGSEPPSSGVMLAGVTTQLACFTVEGMIRASVRSTHHGICHPPSVIWHAYCRWAKVQGLSPRPFEAHYSSSAKPWPDGWLAKVPAMSAHRGNARATAHALRVGQQGSLNRPGTSSAGCQGVIRTLPIGVVVNGPNPVSAAELAREATALTHGGLPALAAAVAGSLVIGRCLHGEDVRASLELGLADAVRITDAAHAANGMRAAMYAGLRTSRDLEVLRRLAPDSTAVAAMTGGLYVAFSFPESQELGAALAFATLAPHGKSVAAVAGAFLGAVHGASALPVDLVSRLELAWVVDTLARDLVLELMESPSGSLFSPGHDPAWWGRYPGW